MGATNVQILPQPIVPASKPDDTGPSTGRSQRNRRYTATVWDQHRDTKHRGGKFARGRPWWGEVEFAANRDDLVGGRPVQNAFVGPLTPGEHVLDDGGRVDRAACFASVWEAPFEPIPKYFKINMLRNALTIDYPRWRADEMRTRRDYWTAAGKLGVQLNVTVDPREQPHPQIVLALGEPSQVHRVIEAAMAGDPWLLGFIDEPNPELARILSIHPLAGFSFDETPIYTREEQQTLTSAVIAAPPSQDLLEMVARMSAEIEKLKAAASKSKKET